MPLVQRQWDSITPFRSQISHRATLSLRETSNSGVSSLGLESYPLFMIQQEVCATLLTLHLLESRPLPETVLIYLAQRMKTLSNMLTGGASTSAATNGSALDAGKFKGKGFQRPRKTVVRETKQKAQAVLDVISRTVGTARRVFASDTSTPSLMKLALQFFKMPADVPAAFPSELQLSTQILLATLPSSSHFLLLPQSICSFTPYIDGASISADTLQPHLQDKLDSWFKKSAKDALIKLSDWFSDISTVRDVWDVRAHLLSWLDTAEGLNPLERRELRLAIDSTCAHQATTVWKRSLGQAQESFQRSLTSASTALEEGSTEHPYGMLRPYA